jgi:hypothetical protein
MHGAPALLLFPEYRENIRENRFFGTSVLLSRQICFRIAMAYGRFPARSNSEAQLGDQGNGLIWWISWGHCSSFVIGVLYYRTIPMTSTAALF